MPAAPKMLEILWNSLHFLQKCFLFFWKSREFSPDLENLLRDLAGRARDLSAELADLGLPQNPRALGNRSEITKFDFLDK